MPVSEKEQQEINTLVRRFEADTGIEAVAAVVGKADAYPEIPWKAYALGSAVGALTATVLPSLLLDWGMSEALAFIAMAILGAGLAFAAAAALVPALGRLFLDRIRARTEARQYALSLFVARQVFNTRNRNAVLLLVARFERVAVILPDSGLAAHAPVAALDPIADAMRDALVRRGAPAAFEAGFAGMAALLRSHGHAPGPGRENALEDGMISETGA